MDSCMTWSKYAMIALSLVIMIRCIRSMLSAGFEAETWATARFGRDSVPVTHWENLIGRVRSADIRVDRGDVERIQAVLKRLDDGRWMIFDVFSRGGVSVNGEDVAAGGAEIESGDTIRVGGAAMRLQDIGAAKSSALDAQRTSAGKSVSPALTLFELTLFELLLLFQHLITASGTRTLSVALGFAVLILLEWFCYYAMRLIGRSGFEVETIAFYLTSLGVSVTASAVPQDMFKQTVLILASFVMFLLLGLRLRDAGRNRVARLLAEVDGLPDEARARERALRRVARVLRGSFRAVDFVCRLGDRRFAVLMTRADSSLNELVLEKIRQINERLSDPGEGDSPVSLRVGVSFADQSATGDSVLNAAKAALADGREQE